MNRPVMYQFGMSLGVEVGKTHATFTVTGAKEPYRLEPIHSVLDNVPKPDNVKEHTLGLFITLHPHKVIITLDSDEYTARCMIMARRVVYVCDNQEEKKLTVWFHCMGKHEGKIDFATHRTYDYYSDGIGELDINAGKDAFNWMHSGILPE